MLVHTPGAWAARLRRTFVDRMLTTVAAESRWTRAHVRSVRVVANAAVQAQSADRAFVDVDLARVARVSSARTVASKTVHQVDALAMVTAWLRRTIVGIDFTARARKSGLAYTLHGPRRRGDATRRVVQAVLFALRIQIDLGLTMGTCEVGQTRTTVVAA